MSNIRVNFEIGHEASLKSKKTPEGFTHDWEVFLRGQEGDISHFVEKVIFQLHNTFPKPRRVVKEPPFSIKESGYAGFTFPIEIYLKNKDEPKKIVFSYDLTLQQSGFLKDRFIFPSPNDDFRKKLIKGGGFPVENDTFYTNPDQESRSRDSFTEEKQQLVSKPKLSTDNVKKHKSKEYKEEIPPRASSFVNLFGPPLQKPPKISPDPKKLEKSLAKPDKKEKDRSSSDKKSKHEHKESKQEKIKNKEEKDKARAEKNKGHGKEQSQEKIKEKSNKRLIERTQSPEVVKKRCLSPIRRAAPNSPPRSSSASSNKGEYKLQRHSNDLIEQKKPKQEEKLQDVKLEKDVKDKKKKDKKSHDRDKERKEKKEHKKESHKAKELRKEQPKDMLKEPPKLREIPKEPIKELTPVKENKQKSEKINKFSMENLRKTPPPETEERPLTQKTKDKNDPERKHKHKKKDKKRDESKEKHKDSNKDKKHKHDKMRDILPEKPEVMEIQEMSNIKERPIPEPASPISIDTASQCSSKSGLTKNSHIGNEDINSSHSDSESSLIAEEEETKGKLLNPSPEPAKIELSPETIKIEPSPEPVKLDASPEPDVELVLDPEPVVEAPPQQKEKSKKHKDKSSKREEKRRKRKAAEEEDMENRKIAKAEMGSLYNETERGESSGSTSIEKVQDNGVSSSLGEDAEPGDMSPDYMVKLSDLQQRIMRIENNDDLERVVNLIAETGRYEVTTQTFDFDLCLLDRSTVQQLIQLVGC